MEDAPLSVHGTWCAHDLLPVLVQVRMVHLSKSTNAGISTKDPMAVPLPIGMGNHGSPVIGAHRCRELPTHKLTPSGHPAYYVVMHIFSASGQPAAELAAPDMLQRRSC
jgi:hypothetical protein